MAATTATMRDGAAVDGHFSMLDPADPAQKGVPSRDSPNGDEKQQDREFISNAARSDGTPLSPSEIVKDPGQMALGKTSRALQLEDFELERTLGTG